MDSHWKSCRFPLEILLRSYSSEEWWKCCRDAWISRWKEELGKNITLIWYMVMLRYTSIWWNMINIYLVFYIFKLWMAFLLSLSFWFYINIIFLFIIYLSISLFSHSLSLCISLFHSHFKSFVLFSLSPTCLLFSFLQLRFRCLFCIFFAIVVVIVIVVATATAAAAVICYI